MIDKVSTLITIHHFDKISILWWIFVTSLKLSTLMKTHYLTIFWKFIVLMKISSIWWKIITLMEAHDYDQTPDEIISLWLKCTILVKIHSCIWKFLKMLEIRNFDENLFFWWKINTWWKLVNYATIIWLRILQKF